MRNECIRKTRVHKTRCSQQYALTPAKPNAFEIKNFLVNKEDCGECCCIGGEESRGDSALEKCSVQSVLIFVPPWPPCDCLSLPPARDLNATKAWLSSPSLLSYLPPSFSTFLCQASSGHRGEKNEYCVYVSVDSMSEMRETIKRDVRQ